LQHEAFLRNAKNSEETLRKEAIERTNLGEKRESQILASIDVGEGEIYQVPATGAVVSMNSAVGLVHFYCSQLPSDRFDKVNLWPRTIVLESD
jgi:endoribonuclease Dicer